MAVAVCTDTNVLQLVMTHLHQDVHRYLLLVKDVMEAAETDVIEELGNVEVLKAYDSTALLCDKSFLATISQLTAGRYPTKCTLYVLFQPRHAKQGHCNF